MVKTHPFDPADYLTSPKAQAELLEDALASEDMVYLSHALGVIARARGMTDIATAAEKSFRAGHDPGVTALLDVARALGVTLSVCSKPAA
ncbi:MAG TPA: addiction module antidote protein [Acetobacteraceae bacterium]|nr:addiction module antidote protein [Acetobacteraceae bacterium]